MRACAVSVASVMDERVDDGVGWLMDEGVGWLMDEGVGWLIGMVW